MFGLFGNLFNPQKDPRNYGHRQQHPPVQQYGHGQPQRGFGIRPPQRQRGFGPRQAPPQQRQGNFSPQGGPPQRPQGNFGPQGGPPQQRQGNFGPQGGPPQQHQGNFGPQGGPPQRPQGNFGPQEGPPQQRQGNFGPQGGPPQQRQGNFGPQGGPPQQGGLEPHETPHGVPHQPHPGLGSHPDASSHQERQGTQSQPRQRQWHGIFGPRPQQRPEEVDEERQIPLPPYQGDFGPGTVRIPEEPASSVANNNLPPHHQQEPTQPSLPIGNRENPQGGRGRGDDGPPDRELHDPRYVLRSLFPIVDMGVSQSEELGVHHEMLNVAVISYLMGKGYDHDTSQEIAKHWDRNGVYPRFNNN